MEMGSVKTTTYCTKTVRYYRAPLTWQLVPDHIKDSKNILEFKK